jgi:hypothetical protein
MPARSPSPEARKLAKQVDDLFVTDTAREALPEWRDLFEKETVGYCDRLAETEAAVKTARAAAVAEHEAVLQGIQKRRLTDGDADTPPVEGYMWWHQVPEIRRTMRYAGVGSWVSPQVYKWLKDGPEPQPWRGPNPSMPVMAMVLALLHDRVLDRTPKLLGSPDDDSEAMAFFRGDCRFDDHERYHTVAELCNPTKPYGERRMDTPETYLNHVAAELARREKLKLRASAQTYAEMAPAAPAAPPPDRCSLMKKNEIAARILNRRNIKDARPREIAQKLAKCHLKDEGNGKWSIRLDVPGTLSADELERLSLPEWPPSPKVK